MFELFHHAVWHEVQGTGIVVEASITLGNCVCERHRRNWCHVVWDEILWNRVLEAVGVLLPGCI